MDSKPPKGTTQVTRIHTSRNGYTRTPQFCFLNGAGRDMYNGRFCRDSIVNFTLVDLPYALNGSLEIRGLVTYNISDPNERVGNMSTYNIANCVQGNNSESREWLTNTHMNSSWMEESKMRRLGDSWNPFAGVGGWFGSFWESIMNFFKKAGMILIHDNDCATGNSCLCYCQICLLSDWQSA